MSSAQNAEITKIQQDRLRVLPIAMIIVPTIVILIRAWSRALLPLSPTSRIATKFWWDDWMTFAAGVQIPFSHVSLHGVNFDTDRLTGIQHGQLWYGPQADRLRSWATCTRSATRKSTQISQISLGATLHF